ncbi:HK97 family phage prohead protease [Niabella insulamsoli]|uniref:HK97 family phage prohead protease n=1 Tax=Niabella insulamsoli TaxID=3144874 RepID=UPI0031FBF324
MAFKKDYIVSTEDINSEGFWVRTDGIDLSAAVNNCPAYIDHRYWELPIGHWENIRKEGSVLMATLVIDGANDRERDVIRKIENGDMKGASIGADPVSWDEEPTQLKNGQRRPTLSKSILFEISPTALPINRNALCLKSDGQPITLSAANINDIIPQLKPTIDMEKIALSLGLSKDATEAQILSAIDANKGKNEAAATLTKELLDKAGEGLDEKSKAIFVTLSQTNVKQALEFAESAKPATIATEAATPPAATQKDVKVSELIKLGKVTQEDAEAGKDSYDYLSRHDKVELSRIRTEEPEKYAKLARDYAKGVRYAGKS